VSLADTGANAESNVSESDEEPASLTQAARYDRDLREFLSSRFRFVLPPEESESEAEADVDRKTPSSTARQ